MGIIRIKMVGFGQSRVVRANFLPTSRAKFWFKSAELAHAESLHDTHAHHTWLQRERPQITRPRLPECMHLT